MFFIAATFFSQITMFNMLIAIMGDTFGRVMEAKETSGVKTKLEILADFSDQIKPKKSKDVAEREVFMFVVKPRADEDNGENSIEGGVQKMSKYMEKSLQALENKIKVNMQVQENLIGRTKDEIMSMQENLIGKATNKILARVEEMLQQRDARQ